MADVSKILRIALGFLAGMAVGFGIGISSLLLSAAVAKKLHSDAEFVAVVLATVALLTGLIAVSLIKMLESSAFAKAMICGAALGALVTAISGLYFAAHFVG